MLWTVAFTTPDYCSRMGHLIDGIVGDDEHGGGVGCILQQLRPGQGSSVPQLPALVPQEQSLQSCHHQVEDLGLSAWQLRQQSFSSFSPASWSCVQARNALWQSSLHMEPAVDRTSLPAYKPVQESIPDQREASKGCTSGMKIP